MSLIVILQYLSINNATNSIPIPSLVVTVTPTESVNTTTAISWNQQGIPIVRGEFAHYTSSDGCVALVIDTPVTSNKSLDAHIAEYTSAWAKSAYPRYKEQYKVGSYESVTLEAMNMEELSNIFVKNGDTVYKITAMMISNSGPPSCLPNYDSAIKDLLQGLRFNQPISNNQKIGFIKNAYIKNSQPYIDIDYVDWIDDQSEPNGFRISNTNPQINTLKISSSAKISLIDWTDKGMIVPQINFDELVRIIKGTSAEYNLGPSIQPFDIDLDKNSLVTKISLHFTP